MLGLNEFTSQTKITLVSEEMVATLHTVRLARVSPASVT